MEKIKCKQNLYKSTYRGFAFTKDKQYNIIDEDKDFFYLRDNLGNIFNLSKELKQPYYYIGNYFDLN